MEKIDKALIIMNDIYGDGYAPLSTAEIELIKEALIEAKEENEELKTENKKWKQRFISINTEVWDNEGYTVITNESYKIIITSRDEARKNFLEYAQHKKGCNAGKTWKMEGSKVITQLQPHICNCGLDDLTK